MKTLSFFSLLVFALCISSCSKNDDIAPSDENSTASNSKAKYKTSFDIAGSQYGNLTFNFEKDGSQLERYEGTIEKDLQYGVTYSHIWLVDMPTSAKSIDDFVSMKIYVEKTEKGTFDIDYYGKGLGYTAVTLRLGKLENDVWVCYKGKVTVTEFNKIGEPIAGTFEGEFFQAVSQKTISVKNGVFSVQHKDAI